MYRPNVLELFTSKSFNVWIEYGERALSIVEQAFGENTMGADNEYERVAEYIRIPDLAKAFGVEKEQVPQVIKEKFSGSKAFDSFTKFLSDNNINYSYYSG